MGAGAVRTVFAPSRRVAVGFALAALLSAAACGGGQGAAPPGSPSDVVPRETTQKDADAARREIGAPDAPDTAPADVAPSDIVPPDAAPPYADAAPPDADAGDTLAPRPAPRPPLAPPAEPYPAWILLDGDVSAALRTLAAAAERDVAAVQLSHGLIGAPEDVLADAGRLERLNTVAAAAAEAGLEVLLWSHELEGDVSLEVCFDPADPLWETRRQAYRDLLDAVPEADGIVLMFGSSNVEPWHAICACDWCRERGTPAAPYNPFLTPSPAERVAWLTRVVADVVVGERGKRLLVRSFVHQPYELDAIGDGLALVDDVPLQPMSKDVPQDWQPYYPLNPLFGRFPERGHVMELDAAGEYWGQSALPFAGVGYVHRRLLDALERGAVGYAVRVERGSHSALGTPNEAALHAAERLLADPSPSPEDLRREWIAARYGLAPESGAAGTLSRVLARTEVIGRRTFYNLGFWALTKGSEPPTTCRAPALLRERSIAKWDDAPEWAALEAALAAPTPAVLASLAQEKHEAAALAAANLADLEAVAAYLAPDDAADLRRRLTLQAVAVDAWAAVTEVVWGHGLWRETGADEHAAWLEDALRRLEALAADVTARVDGDPWPVVPARLAACAEDVRSAFPDDVAPSERRQPTLSPPAVAPCAPDLCVTVEASEPLRLALRFGWRLPYPARRLEGPDEAVTRWTFRVPPLPDGRWAVLRAEAVWSEGTLLGGDVWVWPADASAAP